MLTFDVPTQINGDVLAAELRAAGVEVESRDVTIVGDELHINAPESTRPTVASVLASHTPPTQPPNDLFSRLAAVEAEVRGMRARAAAVAATGGAAAVRDAITGKPGT